VETAQKTTATGEIDPMVSFVFKTLPPTGATFPRDAQQQWLRMLELALMEAYPEEEESSDE
jgi:hypothetical protein